MKIFKNKKGRVRDLWWVAIFFLIIILVTTLICRVLSGVPIVETIANPKSIGAAFLCRAGLMVTNVRS